MATLDQMIGEEQEVVNENKGNEDLEPRQRKTMELVATLDYKASQECNLQESSPDQNKQCQKKKKTRHFMSSMKPF